MIKLPQIWPEGAYSSGSLSFRYTIIFLSLSFLFLFFIFLSFSKFSKKKKHKIFCAAHTYPAQALESAISPRS